MAGSQDTTDKTCAKCGETKERAEFYRQSAAKDGLQAWCKSCAKYRSALWRKEHPDYWAKYRDSDLGRNTIATYSSLNRDRMRASRALYKSSARGRERNLAYSRSARGLETSRRFSAKSRRKYSERHQARSAVSKSIKAGTLSPEPCSVCGLKPMRVNGLQRIQAHHHKGYDEEHWLDIIWLCGGCHQEVSTS